MARNYTQADIACKCGCGIAHTTPEVEDAADAVCDNYGEKVPVNSWCRCPHHNEEVGGSRTSSHISTPVKPGVAIDFRIPGSTPAEQAENRPRLEAAMRKAGFNRIGIGKTFIHGDMDHTKAPATWRY